ncbi:hypothetical protein [Celeribacter baekdonensis]|uniref:AAA+ family ATPase n=1 Tax=Celeribacter baekdonensis TaxID=875171 RepID=A0A2R4LZR7_9RHOB|nr:hypothetical protein [Celeribacter baekdonensis]AVW90413.1 hypothetical protein DA792_04370 [Celeribacter baekdonensis]
MKQIVARLSLSLLVLSSSPATAQEASEGIDLMREGARILLEQLFQQMEPALKELDGVMDDLNAYEPPVVLPNGDILIRRKPPTEAGPEPDQDAAPDGDIEI